MHLFILTNYQVYPYKYANMLYKCYNILNIFYKNDLKQKYEIFVNKKLCIQQIFFFFIKLIEKQNNLIVGFCDVHTIISRYLKKQSKLNENE